MNTKNCIIGPHRNDIMFSLVIYVPSTHAEKMREVLAISKAGAVGNYDSCSFTGAGTGRCVPVLALTIDGARDMVN